MINMTVSISCSCLVLASKWKGRQNGKEGKKWGGGGMTHQTKLKMERKCKQEKGQARETPSPEKKRWKVPGTRRRKRREPRPRKLETATRRSRPLSDGQTGHIGSTNNKQGREQGEERGGERPPDLSPSFPSHLPRSRPSSPSCRATHTSYQRQRHHSIGHRDGPDFRSSGPARGVCVCQGALRN